MDIDKLEKTSEKIGTMYDKGLSELVKGLFKTKEKIVTDDFVNNLKDLDVDILLKSKLKNIEIEYTKGHIEVLESTVPPIKND